MGIFDLFRKNDNQHTSHTTYWARHRQDLVNAAGIGVARLRCHKDTWGYFTQALAKDTRSHGVGQVFRAPSEQDITDEGNGMIVVPLSGSSLAAVLSFCRESQGAIGNWSSLEQAIGRRVESAISAALERVEPTNGDSSSSPVIVLDDRPALVSEAARP